MFEDLGIRYGIDELRELASSISLAGGHGARVRQSLIAKSEALPGPTDGGDRIPSRIQHREDGSSLSR